MTLGVLVFFSTPEGDAWMLDAEEGLASCLMQDGERRDTPSRTETGQGVSVAWESAFAIEGGCFFTRSADGQPTAWPGYLAEAIRRAIRRAAAPPG